MRAAALISLTALALSACATTEAKPEEPRLIYVTGSITKVTPVKTVSMSNEVANNVITTMRVSQQQTIEFLGRCENAKISRDYSPTHYVALKTTGVGFGDNVGFTDYGGLRLKKRDENPKNDYPLFAAHSCNIMDEILASG